MSAGFPYEITLEANVTYNLFATGQNVYFQGSNIADINNKVIVKTQYDEAQLNVGMGVEMSDTFTQLFVESTNAQTITLYVSDRGIYDNRLSLDSSVVQTAPANFTKLLNETSNANLYSVAGYAPIGTNPSLGLSGYVLVNFTSEVYISNLVVVSYEGTGSSIIGTPPDSTLVGIFNSGSFTADGDGIVFGTDLYEASASPINTVRTSPAVLPSGSGRVVTFKRAQTKTAIDFPAAPRPFFPAETPLRIASNESLYIFSSNGGQIWFTCDVRTNSST
jgi:hypothetical protein